MEVMECRWLRWWGCWCSLLLGVTSPEFFSHQQLTPVITTTTTTTSTTTSTTNLNLNHLIHHHQHLSPPPYARFSRNGSRCTSRRRLASLCFPSRTRQPAQLRKATPVSTAVSLTTTSQRLCGSCQTVQAKGTHKYIQHGASIPTASPLSRLPSPPLRSHLLVLFAAAWSIQSFPPPTTRKAGSHNTAGYSMQPPGA